MKLSVIGVNAQKEKRFEKKGIHSAEDLLRYIPKSYKDYRQLATHLIDGAEQACLVRVDEVKSFGQELRYKGSYVQTSSSAAGQTGSNPEEVPTAKAAGGSLDYRKQKEEQSRLRTQQNDLKTCESEISSLEERNTAIDEEMARPENCTDLSRLSQLQKEKSANEDRLAELYEKWEELSEALS